MSFAPDIVVTVPDTPGVSLVVETKQQTGALDEMERQLKSYMLHMDCPVGLIVTLGRFRIYKNRFLERSERSIEMVADFPTQELLGGAAELKTESLLETKLLHWLDELARTGQASARNPKLNAAISEYIVPAVAGGMVSFAHPAP